MKQDEGVDRRSTVVNHGSEMTVVISTGEEESLPLRRKFITAFQLRGKRISSNIKIPDGIRLTHAEQNGNTHCCVLCLITVRANFVNYTITNTLVSANCL